MRRNKACQLLTRLIGAAGGCRGPQPRCCCIGPAARHARMFKTGFVVNCRVLLNLLPASARAACEGWWGWDVGLPRGSIVTTAWHALHVPALWGVGGRVVAWMGDIGACPAQAGTRGASALHDVLGSSTPLLRVSVPRPERLQSSMLSVAGAFVCVGSCCTKGCRSSGQELMT